VTERCRDEPGEFDEYLLTTAEYVPLAGNVRAWPPEHKRSAERINLELIDLAFDRRNKDKIALHRAVLVVLSDGHHLLVGRNLTQLARMRVLIRKALVRTVGMTLLFGFGTGFLLSRRLAGELDQINKTSRAILRGDLAHRIPVAGRGDEIDELAQNLNRMLDRIESLMEGVRSVTDNVAHDLRKPISRVRSRIEVALMRAQDSDTYREILLRTLEDIDEILKVFNSLLAIASLEGQTRQGFTEIDLSIVARATMELYEPAIEEAGLEAEFDAPESVHMNGERHLISQALANLIDNAIKYAPSTGKLRVSVSTDSGSAILQVTDRGRGIPDSFRTTAFDRFTRLDQSRSTPGNGLGLSLVRAVATLHGGMVELDDADPGLAVTLVLPLADPPSPRT
jgi:signal transduction histidine kinase